MAKLSSAMAKQIETALAGLRYGSIQLIVHEARVVRLERVEKIQLTDPADAQTLKHASPAAHKPGSDREVPQHRSS